MTTTATLVVSASSALRSKILDGSPPTRKTLVQIQSIFILSVPSSLGSSGQEKTTYQLHTEWGQQAPR